MTHSLVRRQPRRTVLLVVLALLLLVVPAQLFISSAYAADPLLSQNRPVVTSSNEDSTLAGRSAVDGDTGTRWASAEGVDPQWIQVDLGSTARISQVKLLWEVAYGRNYTIQTSDNGTTWTTIHTVTNGDGGTDDLAVTGTGRYVRMHGTRRATSWGYSLYEFQVYGTTSGDVQPPTVPANLRSTGSTGTTVSLQWNPSTDNVGVTGYDVFQGATQIGTVPGTTHTVTGLTPATTYSFQVRARDAAGAVSGKSNTVTVTTPQQPGGTTPVAINGQLHVCGLNVCNQYNKPIQLRGMSTHGIQWHENCVTDASLNALATDWQADVLRISLYVQEGGYETDPAGFTEKVHRMIEQVTARGMYAVVDWHQLDPGDPNYNLSRARTYFTAIANRHKDKNNIIYEIANEPNGVAWSAVKSYADQMIPLIRGIDADAPILVGTHGWGSLGVSDGRSEADIINNPVNFPNILYTFHFYAASHRDEYLNALSRAADRIPMWVSEYGTQTYTGGGANDFTMSQRYIDLMAAKKISWTSWNYSDDPLSGAAFTENTCENGGPFTGAGGRLKPAGAWVRGKIISPADNFPTS